MESTLVGPVNQINQVVNRAETVYRVDSQSTSSVNWSNHYPRRLQTKDTIGYAFIDMKPCLIRLKWQNILLSVTLWEKLNSKRCGILENFETFSRVSIRHLDRLLPNACWVISKVYFSFLFFSFVMLELDRPHNFKFKINKYKWRLLCNPAGSQKNSRRIHRLKSQNSWVKKLRKNVFKKKKDNVHQGM